MVLSAFFSFFFPSRAFLRGVIYRGWTNHIKGNDKDEELTAVGFFLQLSWKILLIFHYAVIFMTSRLRWAVNPSFIKILYLFDGRGQIIYQDNLHSIRTAVISSRGSLIYYNDIRQLCILKKKHGICKRARLDMIRSTLKFQDRCRMWGEKKAIVFSCHRRSSISDYLLLTIQNQTQLVEV